VLKKHLWRFRFSLITLLLLMTATCCCLGFLIYTQQGMLRPANAGAWSTPGTVTYVPVAVTDPTQLPIPSMPSARPIPVGEAPANAVPFPATQAAGNDDAVVQ
jgi:hypothetical protein